MPFQFYHKKESGGAIIIQHVFTCSYSHVIVNLCLINVENEISPYAKFKIKVFEDSDSKFTGYSNLQVIDEIGFYNCAVGYGNTIEEALEDAIRYFIEMTAWKSPEKWGESDFLCSDSFDF